MHVPIAGASHYAELEEAFGAAAPFLAGAGALALLLLLASGLPAHHPGGRLVEAVGRRQLAFVGSFLAFGAVAGVLIVYWVL